MNSTSCKELKKKWEIMKAFEEGAEIEAKPKSNIVTTWHSDYCTSWDWSLKEYRVKKQKWQPSEQGDFYITSDNQIDTHPSDGHVDFGVVFYSLDDAEKTAKVFRKFHRLYQLALDFNEGWIPDWTDGKQRKYFVEYDNFNKEWNINYTVSYQLLNSIYFKSQRIAKHAIKMIEEGALE